MSSYALRGATIACYLAIGYEAYSFFTQTICPFSLSYPENHSRRKWHQDHAAKQAEEMGLKKEIVVISGSEYLAYGNTFLLGKVGVSVPVAKEEDPSIEDNDWTRFCITETLVRVRSNEGSIEKLAVLAAFVFYSYFRGFGFSLECKSLSATCELLLVGVVTTAVVKRWFNKYAYRTAMKYCSRDVNRAAVEKLKSLEKGSDRSPLGKRIFGNGNKIRELNAYIEKQGY
jgi:hypothetical protein